MNICKRGKVVQVKFMDEDAQWYTVFLTEVLDELGSVVGYGQTNGYADMLAAGLNDSINFKSCLREIEGELDDF